MSNWIKHDAALIPGEIICCQSIDLEDAYNRILAENSYYAGDTIWLHDAEFLIERFDFDPRDDGFLELTMRATSICRVSIE